MANPAHNNQKMDSEMAGSRNSGSDIPSDQTSTLPSLPSSYATITDISELGDSDASREAPRHGNGRAAPSAAVGSTSESSISSSSELEMAVTSMRLDPADFQFNQGTLLGKGNFGAVYRARYRNELVALKQLYGDQSEDFWREVNAMTVTTNRHIAKIIGIIKEEGYPLSIVSELLVCNLRVHMDANRQMSLFDRLRLMRDAAMGVAFLHSHDPQIIHRDLKPENLLIADDGRVKLGDMGLVWTQGVDGESIEPSENPAGSVLYMAPEVLLGKEKVGTPSDVYALGLLMWHIMTGQMPYAEWTFNTKPNFTHAICHQHHRPAPILPLTPVMAPHSSKPASYEDMTPIIALIQSLLNDCWHSNPSARPSAQQVVDFLDAIILRDLSILPQHAQNLWMDFQHQNWDQRFCVPFPKFWNQIRLYIEGHRDIYPKMLTRLPKALRVIFRIPESDEHGGEISFEDFCTFFLTFSPRKVCSVAETMINFYDTIREGFFFGNLSREEQTAKQDLCVNLGTVIVRYGNNITPFSRLSLAQLVLNQENNTRSFVLHNIRIQDGAFSISHDGKVYQALSLRALLELFAPKYKVPSLPNPFAHIFIESTESDYAKQQVKRS